MDQIGEALRKARERRKTSQGAQAAVQRQRGRRDQASGPMKITYEKTRTVKVAHRVLEDHRVIAGFPRHPQADTYRILRAQVLRWLAEIDGTTLGIVSPGSGDGKTLTCVNLAVSMAMVATHTVLLVDLDLRRPRIHEYFGLTWGGGVSDYLLGKGDVADYLVHPGIDRLVILPAGRALHYSSEALASSRMEALVKEMKGRYPDRLVVFDLPPLLASDDSLVLLPNIDASILVVQEGKTRSDEVQRCIEILGNHSFVGTVLNNSTENNPHSYY